MPFVVGDFVTWSSQSQGSSTTKTGKVIEIVPASKRPQTIKHFGSRAHESYIVEVPGKELKRGGHAKSQSYWPLVSKLNKARTLKTQG